MRRGSRAILNEKFLEHPAPGLLYYYETEPVLLEKLSEHGQLDLLYDSGTTSAFVLAKMEIAGIKVKNLEMQVVNLSESSLRRFMS